MKSAASMPRVVRWAGAVAALVVLCGWSRPLPHFHAPRSVRVPILMYHRVGALPIRAPAITKALTVPSRTFAAQMRWLHASGFHAITQGQLLGASLLGLPLPRRPILITFDDGYRDVLWNAAPLLHRLRMPATMYVITDRVDGNDPSFVTWSELRRLERLGFDIGSHTVHHVDLTRDSPEAAAAELVVSKRTLEQRLGRAVPWFAYPLGRVDRRKRPESPAKLELPVTKELLI